MAPLVGGVVVQVQDLLGVQLQEILLELLAQELTLEELGVVEAPTPPGIMEYQEVFQEEEEEGVTIGQLQDGLVEGLVEMA
jgi:uncharacterized membrane protein